MLDILIADDNINYAINLMNFINSKNNNIRVCNIALNGKMAIDAINSNKKIDIVLLDLNMPIYNGNEVLNLIKNKEKYANSIIVISGEKLLMKDISQMEMIYSVIDKLSTMNDISTKINELVTYKQVLKQNRQYKKLIERELLYLGYNISHKGTIYLVDTINYIKSNPNKLLDNLSKSVYPIIAKNYKESIHNIKCRISYETKEMYLNCKISKLQKYLHYSTDTKPNVKTIINTIINKLN